MRKEGMQQASAHKQASATCMQTAERSSLKSFVAFIMSVCLVMSLTPAVSPTVAFADTITADTSWYVGHENDTTYTISTRAELAGLAEIVNAGTEDFDGKTIVLSQDINVINAELVPIGTSEHPFNGTFDGQSHTLRNFQIASDAKTNVGVFGYTGPDSCLSNLTLEDATLTLSATAQEDTYIENVGILVGYCEGTLSNITVDGDLTISSDVVQKSAEEPFVVERIGGIAGVCYQSIDNCTFKGTLSLSATSAPVSDYDEAALIGMVGGIVGFAGDLTQYQTTSTADSHGTISNCENNGYMYVDTPSEAGVDRFGVAVVAQSTQVGGIAGYSRGSIISCSNTAYLRIENAEIAGGIVGSLRSVESTENSNYGGVGSDEGAEDDEITVEMCTNTGIVYARAAVGGIVGQAGTYTTIMGCINGSDPDTRETLIIGTRWNKPFVGGIVGRTYGEVCYCGNLGIIASATWDNEEARTINSASGYYTSGIAGGIMYYSATNDQGAQVRVSPIPEVYNCYNAGSIETKAGYRSRNIVGYNEGNGYNNAALDGKCPGNACVHGEASSDEDYSGIGSNNLICAVISGYDQTAEDSLKGNGIMTYKYRVGVDGVETWYEGTKDSIFEHLNSNAEVHDWEYYWTYSQDGTTNAGYPVLNWQAEEAGFDKTDLSNATLTLVSNATYSGGEAIPQVSATLDGVALVQGVDFKVVPQSGAIEITDGATPYAATIEGIGQYTGTSKRSVAYGIDKGDLSTCSATIDTTTFNWEAQEPTTVEVKDAYGNEVSSDEYTFALAEGVEAINAGSYAVVIKAKDDSTHFEGELEASFSITKANIKSDLNLDEDGAYITYLGEDYDWYSSTNSITEADADKIPVFTYTGHSIQPTVSNITYLGVELVEGRDYRIIYGDLGTDEDDGPSVDISSDNAGTEGEIAYGAITVRFVAGSNFTNYENMVFIIDGTTSACSDITQAEVSAPDVIYEGEPMEPVTVTYGGQTLVEGTDYEITYTNNDAVGTASYAIVGIGYFEGTIEGTFAITDDSLFDFTFEITTIDGVTGASITGFSYNGTKESFTLVIPDTVESNGVTYSVIAIGDGAFGGTNASDFTGTDKLKITAVEIPASVISIGSYAFGTSSTSVEPTITSVIFAENSALTTIGTGAFSRCKSLTSFTFPAQVTTIASRAFYNCTALTTLVFETEEADMPTSIGSDSFQGVGGTRITVSVVGHASATRVQQLATDNATTATVGTGANGGKHFVFVEYAGDFSQVSITGIEESYVETGSAIEPVPTVTLDGETLVAGTDYSVSYSNNTEPGTATVTITPLGGFAGQSSITVEFTIAADSSSADPDPDDPDDSDEPTTDTGTMDVYAGAGRYETAAAITQEVAANGSYSGIIVASAENGKFADALSGSGLSGVLDYPIVLVNGSADSLDASAAASLEAIADGSKLDVIVLGGTGTVSEGVASALAGYDSDGAVVRLAGDDRYETAEQVYAYGAEHGAWNTSVAFVAKGNDFPDALAAASYCAANDVPLMLTDQNSDTLPTWVTEALGGYDSALVIGGTASVSDGKLAVVDATVKGGATRMDGSDRYDTALKLVEWELENGMSLEGAGFATGASFPDALGSASLLAQTGSVLVLVSPDGGGNAGVYAMLAEMGGGVSGVSVFGGVNSVPLDVRASIQSALGGTWSVVDKAA